ncbi:NAD(P)/FAD-dependent oxidoreductase [Yinghuangia aomiensis]
MDGLRHIVVVGGGPAGVTAVETLRREGHAGPIVLVTGEPGLPYDRPPLSKQVLTGAWESDRIRLRAAAHYRDLGVTMAHARATALDRDRRRLRLDDGGDLAYDGLIIATGVRPRQLPGNRLLKGVHVLRDLGHADRLRTDLLEGGRLVVVGAGFLGMEVAASARGLGLDVTVVDPAPLPMLRQLGGTVAEAVARLHRAHGIGLRLGVGVRELRDDGRQVTAVALSDGTVVPADCVLVAIGASPAVDWLRSSGLPLGDGIECDEYCRTAPRIHAAGDAASWVNPRYGRRMRLEHRTNAGEQGAAAAFNLLHGPVRPYAPLPYFWTDQFGIKVQACGVLAEDSDVAIEFGAVEQDRFVAAYRSAGRLTGVVTWNAPAQMVAYRAELLGQDHASSERVG